MNQKYSNGRPQRPTTDPLLLQIVQLLRKDKRSRYAQANDSGLAQATLKNWDLNKVHHPQSSSIQMAARALGYKLTLMPNKPR